MHLRRVPRRNNRDRFALVTSENQLKVDVSKDCCAPDCMSAIGKDKLRSLWRYYFSLTGDEQDTYLITHMQMLKEILSDIKISFEYSMDYNVVELHSRFCYVLATWDYIECNNELSTVISVLMVVMFQVWRVHPKEMPWAGWRTTSSLTVKYC